MASGRIIPDFDIVKLIRVAPLISSTATLVHALAELNFLGAMVHPNTREKCNEIVPKVFRNYFSAGVQYVIAYGLTSVSLSIVNLVGQYSVSGASRQWYMAGMAYAVAHYLFLPKVASPVRDIIEDASQGKSTEDLDRWLSIHRVRMAVADIPAWLCYILAICN
uniref:ARAD1C03124p n=1 Tax=Blastobotrys adeninivorans TaxID=409370 RepID=A0A060T4B2_BLAAD